MGLERAAARVGERKEERRQRELDGSEESWEQEKVITSRPKNQMKRGLSRWRGSLARAKVG